MTTMQDSLEEIAGYRPRMTEEEFEAWSLRERARAEWVEGEVIPMSPVNYDHSKIQIWLSTLMNLHVSRHKLGQVHGPEFMNRLKGRRRLPDLFFVSKGREGIFRETCLDGPADLIVEVVSPDSQSRDRRDKYLEYEANGVREYWIIDPLSRQAEFYVLRDGKYVAMEVKEGVIRSKTLAGFWLKLEWLWQRPLPNEYETAKVLGIF
jgi:Uma2 family endonuclease